MPAVLNTFSDADLDNATYATLYTAAGATNVSVVSCIFCNKTGVDRTVNVRVVRSGGTPVLQVLNAEPIPANSALELVQGKGIVLKSGDQLQAQASAASAIDVTGSVVEQT